MPQTFLILKCYKCMCFQVHQAKRSNKWACKLCGEKQSLKRNYGIGTAKDCRLHVQKLNGIRKNIDETPKASDDELEPSPDPDSDDDKVQLKNKNHPSKWISYLDNIEEVMNDPTNASLNEAEVDLEISRKRKKVNNWNTPYNRHCQESDLHGKSENNTEKRLSESLSQCSVPKRLNYKQYKPDRIGNFKNTESIPNSLTKHDIETNKNKCPEIKPEQSKLPSKWKEYVVNENNDDIGDTGKHIKPINEKVVAVANHCNYQDIDDFLDF